MRCEKHITEDIERSVDMDKREIFENVVAWGSLVVIVFMLFVVG